MTVVIALDRDQRIVIFARQRGYTTRQLRRCPVAMQLGALQATTQLDDFGARVITIAAATGGIDGDQVRGLLRTSRTK